MQSPPPRPCTGARRSSDGNVLRGEMARENARGQLKTDAEGRTARERRCPRLLELGGPSGDSASVEKRTYQHPGRRSDAHIVAYGSQGPLWVD